MIYTKLCRMEHRKRNKYVADVKEYWNEERKAVMEIMWELLVQADMIGWEVLVNG